MKKALIFQGGWDGHEPALVANIFKEILEKNSFKVDLFDTMNCLSDLENLKTYDLIVPIWTMGEIDNEHCKNVCLAVESGVGLAGCHGGMCDSFRNNVDWQFMTGAQWVAHPGSEIDYKVNLCPDNQFTTGLNDFDIHSEQYYIHVDPAVKIFATTTFPVAEGPHSTNGKVKVPVVFTKYWGKGKVFYSSLGHVASTFDIHEVKEIMTRGLIWASKS